MEQAARRFAQKVLAAHVALLLVIVALVALATYEIYRSTKQQAIDQATRRQELLAKQTAAAIESHYRSILADLELLGRLEELDTPLAARLPVVDRDTPAGRAVTREANARFGAVLWKQLEGRVSHLFFVPRHAPTYRPARSFPDDGLEEARAIAALAGDWLRQVEKPAVSGLFQLGRRSLNLVAVPAPGDLLLVAAVPIPTLEAQFLANLNLDEQHAAWLGDADGTVMAGKNDVAVGINLRWSDDPRVRELITQVTGNPGVQNRVLQEPVRLGDRTLPPAIVSAVPVKVAGGQWSLVVTSGLAEVNEAVNRLFGRALFWAIFVIVSVTAVLVSTAVQMIRGRLRLERLQHEAIAKELEQARQIQLAWLPQEQPSCTGAQLAAVNHPANHISGDFYNWFDLPDGRTVVTIGDVTGHGLSAAFLMATTQLLVRTNMLRFNNPGRCLHEVNRQLCLQTFHGQFVTLQILVLDPDSGTVEAATAGHPPPLIDDGDGFRELDIEPQLVLGVDPEATYRTERFAIPDRCALLLYTDGVCDAQAPGGDRFESQRLLKSLCDAPKTPEEMIDCVTRAVDQFRQDRTLSDDLTLVAIHVGHPRSDTTETLVAAASSST